MDWGVVAAVSPATGLLAVAVWRFTKLEAAVKHQAKCQRLLARAIIRLKRQMQSHFKETPHE